MTITQKERIRGTILSVSLVCSAFGLRHVWSNGRDLYWPMRSIPISRLKALPLLPPLSLWSLASRLVWILVANTLGKSRLLTRCLGDRLDGRRTHKHLATFRQLLYRYIFCLYALNIHSSRQQFGIVVWSGRKKGKRTLELPVGHQNKHITVFTHHCARHRILESPPWTRGK